MMVTVPGGRRAGGQTANVRLLLGKGRVDGEHPFHEGWLAVMWPEGFFQL